MIKLLPIVVVAAATAQGCSGAPVDVQAPAPPQQARSASTALPIQKDCVFQVQSSSNPSQVIGYTVLVEMEPGFLAQYWLVARNAERPPYVSWKLSKLPPGTAGTWDGLVEKASTLGVPLTRIVALMVSDDDLATTWGTRFYPAEPPKAKPKHALPPQKILEANVGSIGFYDPDTKVTGALYRYDVDSDDDPQYVEWLVLNRSQYVNHVRPHDPAGPQTWNEIDKVSRPDELAVPPANGEHDCYLILVSEDAWTPPNWPGEIGSGSSSFLYRDRMEPDTRR